MVILGIDPGLASTGFGAITFNSHNSPALLRCGCIKTSAGLHISSRLAQIYNDIEYIIKSINPGLVAIENIFSLVRYPKAGILLGGVLGIIHLSVFQNNIQLVEITPKEVKSSLVGYGSANKKQIKEATQKALKISEISSFHSADALAIALTAYYRKSYRGIK
jgi:crossover junction endodeoxyribonuclease RuvC